MAGKNESRSVSIYINGDQANGMLRNLEAQTARLRNELRGLAPGTEAFKRKLAELKDSRQQLQDINEEIRGVKKSLSTMDVAAGGFLANMFSGALDQLMQVGQKVLDTTVKFEKMEAVLTNTLGSRSAAKQAMDQIVQFAAKTPFQVDQLTEAYVKLANQGFTPSMEEMRKLGDLASSTGKDFDQLAEAILDASTGEFERLKEFGIKAQKEGDKVTFTFKGVKTTVDNTSDAIRNYVLALGDVEGVSGSMEAVSKTLGGQISNLEDGFTRLWKAIGEDSKGPIAMAVNGLSSLVDSLTELQELENKGNSLGMEKPWFNTFRLGESDFTRASGAALMQDKWITDVLSQKQTGGMMKAHFESLLDEYKQYSADNSEFGKAMQQNTLANIRRFDEHAVKIIEEARKKDAPKEETAEQKKAREKAEKEAAKKSKEAKEALEKLLSEINKVEQENFNNRLEEYDKQIAEIHQKYDKLRAGAKGDAKLITRLDNAEADEVTQANKKQQEEEAKKLKEIQKKAEEELKKKLDDQTKLYQAGLSGRELELAQVDEHYKSLLELAEKYGYDSTEILKRWGEAKFKAQVTDQEKYEELVKKENEKVYEAAIQSAEEVSTAAFSIASSNRDAESQQRISAIERERDYELSNKNLTEAEKARIKQKYDKKLADEKLRAWRADQRAGITQALMNGALAVTKLLAQLGVFSWAAMGPVIAATALQVGTIAAQKPPQYEEGGFSTVDNKMPKGWVRRPTLFTNGARPFIAGENYKPEYIISSEQLKDPVIADFVGVMESIRGVRRFEVGGYSDPSMVTIEPRFNQNVSASVDMTAMIYELQELRKAVESQSNGLNYKLFSEQVEFDNRLMDETKA